MLALLLAACGGDPGQTSAGETGTIPPDESTATQPSTDAAFPVTIEHKYGSTEVAQRPERVVTVGLTDQDSLLALGIAPVGTVEWSGEYPGAIGPWVQDEFAELGAEVPEVVSGFAELDFEAIAALRPDLILGLYSGLTQDDYETLSQIAPTVAQSGEYGDYGMPWQEITLTVGRAVGREERAEELIAEVEERFAEAREQHPEFDRATTALASTFGEGSYYVYDPEDPRVRFLASLGFEMPSNLLELIEQAPEKGGVPISDERFDEVDVDMLIWFVASEQEGGEGTGFRSNPLYVRLDVASQGRDILMAPDTPLYYAYNFNTVLSLPFAIERLVPQLAAAVDGDPATEVTPTP